MVKSKYFSEEEFAALGCSLNDMDPKLMEKLDLARGLAGIPFRITSAYRTPERNAEVGGVAGSAHTKGKAVDISCGNGSQRWLIVVNAVNAGFRRIGIGKNFVHLDNDDTLPHPVIFDYYG